MKTELIERYLTRQMTDEERAAFEQEMREQPQLAEDVKIVAWTIEAIRERGQQEDAERITRMREDMGNDSKRYATTVAAVIGGVLIVAAATIVSVPPLYRNVIKPIIESVFSSGDKTDTSAPQIPTSSTPSTDSLATGTITDSLNVNPDIQEDEQDAVEEPQQQEAELVKEETKKEDTTVDDVAKPKTKTEPKVEEPMKKDEPTSSKNINISGQNWQDEFGTKYNPYSLEVRGKSLLVLHISIVNNNSDRIINISDKPTLLDEAGNMHYANKVLINGKSGNYSLRRTAKAEMEVHFNIATNPQRIQYISFSDKNATTKGKVKNLIIN